MFKMDIACTRSVTQFDYFFATECSFGSVVDMTMQMEPWSSQREFLVCMSLQEHVGLCFLSLPQRPCFSLRHHTPISTQQSKMQQRSSPKNVQPKQIMSNVASSFMSFSRESSWPSGVAVALLLQTSFILSTVTILNLLLLSLHCHEKKRQFQFLRSTITANVTMFCISQSCELGQ